MKTKEKKEKKKTGNKGKVWRAIGIAIAFFVVFLTLQAWVSLIGTFVSMGVMAGQQGIEALADPQAVMNGTMENLTLFVLISNALTVLVFWLFYLIRKKSFVKEIWLRKTNWKTLLLSVAYGFGMCFAVDLLTRLLPVPDSMMETFEMQHNMLWQGNMLVTFLSVAILAPLAEEVTFRGLIYTNLRKAMKPIFAAIISAVFFGIAHGNPIWFLVGFAAGMAMAWLYERTGSFLCTLIVHITNNTLAFVTNLVPMPDAVNYILIGLAIAVLPLSVYFILKFNPKRREEDIPKIDILEDSGNPAAIEGAAEPCEPAAEEGENPSQEEPEFFKNV